MRSITLFFWFLFHSPLLAQNCDPYDENLVGNLTKCEYVKSDDCEDPREAASTGFEYIVWYFCAGTVGQAFLVVLYAYILLNIFVVLGEVADVYFAPTMKELSETLQVSETVSGVTFMAFGNGAPDIMSSIHALSGPNAKLGLAALFGAAVFVPVCVAGNVALAVPDAKVHRLSYLRDVIWLFCSVGFIWVKVCNEGSVNFFESILMWILYALYVFSVIIAEFWRKDHPENAEDLADDAVLDAYAFYEARKSVRKSFAISMHMDGMYSPDPARSFLRKSNMAKVSHQVRRRFTQTLYDPESSGAEMSRMAHSVPPGGNRLIAPTIDMVERSSFSESYAPISPTANTMADRSRPPGDNILLDTDAAESPNNLEIPTKLAVPGIVVDSNHSSPPTTPKSPANLEVPTTGNEWGKIAPITLPEVSDVNDSIYKSRDSGKHHDESFLKPFSMKSDNFLSSEEESNRRSKRGPSNSKSHRFLGDDEMHQPFLGNHLSPSTKGPETPPFNFEDVVLTYQLDEEGNPTMWGRVYFLMTLPAQLILAICAVTCPNMEPEEWNPYLSCIFPISSPIWGMYGFDLLSVSLAGCPLVVFILAFNLIPFSYVIYIMVNEGEEFSLENRRALKVYFLCIAFMATVAWISLIAGELVTLLSTIGIIAKIPSSILGFTVLAWGNSIGDLVANVGVAKAGKPAMAISACFGGPLLNILIGVGVSSTINTLHHKYDFPSSTEITLATVGVLGGCLIHLGIVPASGFLLTKFFGYACLACYAAWAVTSVLIGFLT